jgi:protein-S-isoprenylcysteine O-methyltransferase Ste14
MTAIRHLVAILLLPATVTIVVPLIIIFTSPAWRFGWGSRGAVLGLVLLLGVIAVGTGLTLLVWTITLFATSGRGALAPWDPPRHLVVLGPYRHVRNPMISGVLAILLGETLLVGASGLLYWFGLFALANALYIPLFEEPALEQRFGPPYVLYKANVPRWLPRIKPWAPPQE